MPRSDDNFFEADNGVGANATTVHVRVTSVYGQQVEETLPIDDSQLLTGTHQFD
jgi:hypothetical protein